MIATSFGSTMKGFKMQMSSHSSRRQALLALVALTSFAATGCGSPSPEVAPARAALLEA